MVTTAVKHCGNQGLRGYDAIDWRLLTSAKALPLLTFLGQNRNFLTIYK